MIAIETIGYGKRTRYVVRAVDERGTIPVDYKIYRTEEAARRAAADLGFTVSAVGDFWHLMHVMHTSKREAVRCPPPPWPWW